MVNRAPGKVGLCALLVLVLGRTGPAFGDPMADGAAAYERKVFASQPGQLVPRDTEQSVSWLIKAAEQGNAEAIPGSADLYFPGRGGPRDVPQSGYREKETANHANVESEIALSDDYFTGMFGFPRDDAQGLVWLQKAAEQGSAKAQHKLALLYQIGSRVPPDDAKVLYWLTKSADQRYCLAEMMMAQRYQLGVGGRRDLDQARAWLVRAADHPLSDKCQNMAAGLLKALDDQSTGSH